jgi:ring-1,2-phenylacetyl-CoA epoxidase subunit PaaD
MTNVSAADLERARSIAAAVVDPEIPVLTLADLGVLRSVFQRDGVVVAEVTPTYLGCPAVLAIELAVESALRDAGFAKIEIVRVLAPAWSTDDITAVGRAKLLDYGIAPPNAHAGKRGQALLFADETVACPKCSSTATEKISQFGSTACKAQWRCRACAEPFDYFKCL